MISKLNTIMVKNNIRVKNRDEVIELLKKYRTILSQPIYDYLNEAISLDISILKDYIGSETRLALSELEGYNEIAKYNIYNRTINVFKDGKEYFGEVNIEDSNGYLTVRNKEFNIKLFEFFYGNNAFATNKSNNIGHISIYKTQESRVLLDADIDAIKVSMDKVAKKVNPYGSYIQHSSTRELAYNWEKNRIEELEEYREFLKNIKERV